jgi:3',5'-nucleoside bisphosphate phosphatase
MKNTDLHTHTYYSDGQFSPSEIVRRAKSKRIKYLSITDHNSVEGNEEAIKEGGKIGIDVIPGVEIVAKEFEVLGYFIDYNNKKLKKELMTCSKYFDEKCKRIINFLKKQGEEVSIAELEKKFPNSKGNYNYGILFYYLISKGYGFDDAVKKVMDAKKEIKTPLIKEILVIKAIKLIRKYGGVAVLAHPWIGKEKFTEKNIKKYLKAGLQGIEYENGEEEFVGRDKRMLDKIKNFSKKYNLILTQGSDYHGPIMAENLKRHYLGSYNCDERVVEELKKLKRN